MLTLKQSIAIAVVVMLIAVAAFLVRSNRQKPEPFIVYKTTTYSPKTETQDMSPSNPSSEVEMRTTSTNEGIDSSEPDREDSLDFSENDGRFDEVFFGDMLGDAEMTKSENEDVPVSPHGFGEYPEVPVDFPVDVNWADYEEDLPVYELMIRVQIKLWKQGHRVTGISQENGLMYPIIRGTVYIKWDRSRTEALEITGHPSDMSDATVSQIETGSIPAGLIVRDYDTEGIDPYEFLNL